MMKRTALICTALLLSCAAIAQNADAGKKTTKKVKGTGWKKPNDFSYYNMMPGYVSSDGEVYGIKAPAFWGQARTCLLRYILNDRPPQHRFHVRDVEDVQIGVGYGSNFYANFMMGLGLKFKYDVSPNMDFGFYPTYRLALDRISYFSPMIHGFVRYRNFLVEAGTGKNSEDLVQSKQRKITHLNLKYFFKPKELQTWSVNVSYWRIDGKNNQSPNEWETMNQYMIGLGKQF